jgi:hypothetical protein
VQRNFASRAEFSSGAFLAGRFAGLFEDGFFAKLPFKLNFREETIDIRRLWKNCAVDVNDASVLLALFACLVRINQRQSRADSQGRCSDRRFKLQPLPGQQGHTKHSSEGKNPEVYRKMNQACFPQVFNICGNS